MLVINGVGDRPSGVLTNSGSSNQARSLANDLLTADGETFMRFAVRVTLSSWVRSCRQSNKLRSRLDRDFFIMLRSPDRGSGQNQNNTHYATGNENPDQHIHGT